MTTHLHIQTKLSNGRTYLAKAYATSPLKIADVTENKQGKQLRLMLMSSSPGILDGDSYDLKINVGLGCSLNLQTQSYQRLFTMQEGASQTMEVLLENGSSLCYIPHPTVPHTGSVYKACNKIYLADDCSLVWGEVITCGRKLSGEQFLFSKLHVVTDIYINNRLAIKENLLIKPAGINISAIGQWEGYTHQASLLFINNSAPVSQLIEEIQALLGSEENIMFGVSLAPINGIVVRMLGYKGEQLFNCLNKIALLLSASPAKQLPVYAS